MNKCEKCGYLHYRTDPYRKKPVIVVMHDQRMANLSIDRLAQISEARAAPKPKRSESRHRPGYFTEYMRGYRARLKASPQAKIERDNDRR